MSDNRLVRYSSSHSAEIQDYPMPDIDRDEMFKELFSICRSYTMTSKETMFALYQAVRFVVERKIPGDFVECGVWKGGSALLATLANSRLEGASRRTWLYDTFEGMTAPSSIDVDLSGATAEGYIASYSDEGKWCYVDLTDVQRAFFDNGVSAAELEFVPGDVLQTLEKKIPDQIAILRLDTDWYESTKRELEVLYPRLAVGGVLIVDDYGHWEGSRKAVDEFFTLHPSLLLNRVNYAVRMAIKI